MLIHETPNKSLQQTGHANVGCARYFAQLRVSRLLSFGVRRVGMGMYLLIRRISEYTAANILLGVFRSPEQAESAKATYAKRYSVEPASDPWREQTYREPGLSSRDLVVQEIPCELGSAEVFVVSNYSEGFGQVFRKFDSLHGSAAEAHARMVQLDAEEDTFPHYALCQRAVIGVVLSDAPEDQPGLE